MSREGVTPDWKILYEYIRMQTRRKVLGEIAHGANHTTEYPAITDKYSAEYDTYGGLLARKTGRTAPMDRWVMDFMNAHTADALPIQTYPLSTNVKRNRLEMIMTVALYDNRMEDFPLQVKRSICNEIYNNGHMNVT